LLLYRRLFYTRETNMMVINRVFSIMYWAATFFTCVYPFIMWITMAAACRPLSFYWRQYVGDTDGKCIDVLLFYLVFGIVNMINDMIILVVPIPRILKLHMNTSKKVSVAGIMLLGSFVCVASIVRIYYLKRLTKEIDVTYILGPSFGWSSLEPSVAIISACLPTFAPLFRGIRNKDSSAKSGGTSDQLKTIGQISNRHGQSHIRIEDEELELTDKKNFFRTRESQTDLVDRDNSSNASTETRRTRATMA